MKLFGYRILIIKDNKKRPKVWSRKGQCPSCRVKTGSKHGKECKFDYLPTKRNKYI